MATMLTNLPVAATSTINPSVFVTIDPTQDFGVYQASGATPYPIGISQAGTRVAPGLQQAEFPGTTPSIQPAAYAGEELQIFNIGDICWVTVGASSVTAGAYLTSDANGNAVAVAQGSGSKYQAISFQAANTGELVNVIIQPGVA